MTVIVALAVIAAGVLVVRYAKAITETVRPHSPNSMLFSPETDELFTTICGICLVGVGAGTLLEPLVRAWIRY